MEEFVPTRLDLAHLSAVIGSELVLGHQFLFPFN